jgi:hypothetical protein
MQNRDNIGENQFRKHKTTSLSDGDKAMKISNQSIQAISSGRSRPGRCFEKVVYNFDLYNSEKYTS